jgi:hypothetical protein
MSAKRIAGVLFLLVLGTSRTFAQSVTNAPCGFSLTVPQHWKITRTPNRDVPCWYTVESLHKKEPCSFMVRTLDGSLETAAKRAGFRKRESKWVMPPSYPLGETIDAEEISGEHWQGIQAENVVRATEVSGEVDASDVWTAVINDGDGHSAIVQGFDCSEHRFDNFVDSFRFISTAK